MVFNLPRPVYQIAEAFRRDNFDVRVVGGATRDLVMGNSPKDWDMATNARPDQTMSILEHIGRPFDLSNGHGTISIVIDHQTYEVTTLRIDAETDGRHARVEYVTDFELDAARRDFTINAMSMDPIDQTIYDYFGGQVDIANQVVRFVGDPFRRIQEDYLRILRLFRFAGRFNFDMATDALNACHQYRSGLDLVSGERIWMEIKQILDTNNPTVIAAMKATGVLPFVLYQSV